MDFMMTDTANGLYGQPPRELADLPAGALQFSPLIPGSETLDGRDQTLASMVMLAPPGTVERRAAMAQALKALVPGGRLTVMALKDKGGSRLAKELAAFGCAVNETSKSHHRICVVTRLASSGELDAAIAEGAPRFVPEIGLWSQPGVFSWDRLDSGSAQLIDALPVLSGHGADFGCGLGHLAHGVLTSSAVKSLAMVDIDRRAVEAARRNVNDPRVTLHWADVRKTSFSDLHFVVMNPPFHDGGMEDKALGKSFIQKAAESLKRGGILWLVANRHLPYEGVLSPLFKRVELKGEANGFKVYEALK
jgi:16S rRNA (guanine1207-N2)-methyltransferase